MNRKPCITDYFLVVWAGQISRKQNVFMGRALIEQRNRLLPLLDKCNTIVPMRKRRAVKRHDFQTFIDIPIMNRLAKSAKVHLA